MSDANYHLTYFPARGRAEALRFVLVLAGQKVEETHVPLDKWPQVKPTTPFLHLPLLKIKDDDMELSETFAIIRHVSRKHGLSGKTPLDEAKIDMISSAFIDIISPILSIRISPTEAKKATLFSETLPAFLPKLEKQLHSNKNKGGSGFYVGANMSYADAVSYRVFHDLLDMEGTVLDKYPLIRAHTERIGNDKNIKMFLKNRPKLAV